VKLFYVETIKLRANPNNLFPPLPMDEYEDLKASIAMYGIKEPLIVVPDGNNGSGGTILAGHHRWRAAKELSLYNVPCIESSHEEEEAVIDTEIFRRMLSKEDRDKYKEMKKKNRQVLQQRYLDSHLLPELMQLYHEGKITQDMAFVAAKLSKDNQRELFALLEQQQTPIEVIVEATPEEKKKHEEEEKKREQEHAELEEQIGRLQNQVTVKEKDLRTLRLQQEKAREVLVEKMEELKMVKENSFKTAGETIRKEVEEKIAQTMEQVETYKTAVMEKNLEIDKLKEDTDTARRRCKDLEGEANAAWVDARIWRDKCVEKIRTFFKPDTIMTQIQAASRSVDTVGRLLSSGIDSFWEDTAFDTSLHELKGLHAQIGELIKKLATVERRSQQVLPIPNLKIAQATANQATDNKER
jgi:hypothetical protein